MYRFFKIALLNLTLPWSLLAGERNPQGPINLNTASVTELMQLPKVGAKTAESVNSNSKCESTLENANPQSRMRISS